MRGAHEGPDENKFSLVFYDRFELMTLGFIKFYRKLIILCIVMCCVVLCCIIVYCVILLSVNGLWA